MAPDTAAPPTPPRSVHRFTIAAYERLVRVGAFGPADRAELIDGWLVDKMPHTPRHAAVVDLANDAIARLLPAGWTTRSQLPVRLLGNNAPEPDVVVVPAPKSRYVERHPTAKEIALVVEVSDTSLDDDLRYKVPQYARAKLPVYWVVNLRARRVEVYTDPRGGKSPGYRTRAEYAPGDDIPVTVGGAELGTIPAADLLP
ncbi:MAG TPA: Uma2 family endonuclease [Urbifossiella sp.]|jgi:Uma2 family endonuclease|nr:Uma2 family endonuclease [Urbifossiella sp.]